MSGQLERITIRIPNGASVNTAPIDLASRRIVAVQAPAAWTAGALSFLGQATTGPSAAESGNTAPRIAAPPLAQVIDDANGAIQIVAAAMAVANAYIALTGPEREALASVRWVQFQSGTLAAPVNQGAERMFFVMVEPRGI